MLLTVKRLLNHKVIEDYLLSGIMSIVCGAVMLVLLAVGYFSGALAQSRLTSVGTIVALLISVSLVIIGICAGRKKKWAHYLLAVIWLGFAVSAMIQGSIGGVLLPGLIGALHAVVASEI